MKKKRHFFYILICSVLVIALAWSLNRNCKVEPITECITDTLFITRVDTLVEYRTKYIDKKVVDTLYVETNGKKALSFPIVQKQYSKKGLFDLWISGIEPLTLDSTKIYQQVQTKVVTNTITNTIVDDKQHLYFSGGLNAFSGTFKPNLNISLSTKKKWLYSLEIGLDEHNKVYYGAKIGCKIF